MKEPLWTSYLLLNVALRNESKTVGEGSIWILGAFALLQIFVNGCFLRPDTL